MWAAGLGLLRRVLELPLLWKPFQASVCFVLGMIRGSHVGFPKKKGLRKTPLEQARAERQRAERRGSKSLVRWVLG